MSDKAAIEATLDGYASLVASDDFEAVRSGLIEVVRLLEQPGLGLNQSVKAYETGRQLADQCQRLLDAAELRVSMLDGTDAASAGLSGA